MSTTSRNKSTMASLRAASHSAMRVSVDVLMGSSDCAAAAAPPFFPRAAARGNRPPACDP